jgi:hypothetical protein
MPSRVIGKNPKPAALIVGFDDTTAERIKGLFPASRLIDHLDEVDQQEWNVLITTRSALGAEHHLYIVGLGCEAYLPAGRTELPSAFGLYHDTTQAENTSSGWVSWTGPSKATQLYVAENLPSTIERLIVTQLAPLARQEREHKCLHPGDIVEPFVSTIRDQCLAGRFLRPGANSECWCFPQYAVPIAPEIVKVALQEWQKRDSETFPVVDWANKAMWRTPAENRIASQFDELEAKRASILAELDHQQQELIAALSAAKQSAEAHERLLLTARGGDLVRVAETCLSDLGFSVTDMDKVYPAGDRREDLQVTASEMPDWIALVEVRAYRRGASAGDLTRMERFRTRFVLDKGKLPDALWYLANQFLEDDPEARPRILASNEPELEAFAEGNGLAIDTADLFRLWMAVKEQRLTAEDARSRLIQASGRFTFDD